MSLRRVVSGLAALDVSQFGGYSQSFYQNTSQVSGTGAATKAASGSTAAASGSNLREITLGNKPASLNDPIGRTASATTARKTEQSAVSTQGSRNQLSSPDMRKAISDMQKDGMLQQYQYFVGSANNLVKYASADGTVIQK